MHIHCSEKLHIQSTEGRAERKGRLISVTELKLLASYRLYLAIVGVAAKKGRRSIEKLKENIATYVSRSESSLGGVSLGGIMYSTLIPR